MQYSKKEQAASLAGVFQAAALVERLARTGQLSEESLQPSIQSIFITSPGDVAEVYGGYDKLSLGQQILKSVLSRENQAIQSDVIRYALALIHLEKKLSKTPAMLNTIGERLERAKDQASHFGILHENVISSLASIYLDTISTFKTRIQVTGDLRYLQMPSNANKIRAILLAGIRSATLWRQLGGTRWHLFLSRKKLLDGLNRL